jgi:hypothetical protein
MWFLKLILGLGSVIDGVFAYLNKKQDIDLEKYKVDGVIDERIISAEIAIIQARASVMSHLTWVHKGFGAVALLYFSAVVYDALTEQLFPSVHWDVMELKGLSAITFNMVVGFYFLQSGVSTLVGKITGR